MAYHKGEIPFEQWMNTFTKFAKTFANGEMQTPQIIDLWENVAFYNFVQEAMQEARMSPTPKQFKDSEAAFVEVLETYKPDFIVFWGHRLWNNFDKTHYQKIGEAHYLVYGDKKYQIFVMPHPSSSYKYDEVHQELMHHLAL